MLVKDLIEALQKLPQDGIVEVLHEYTRNWDTITEMRPANDIYILDFSKDEGCLYAGKVFIQLRSD